MHNRPGYAAVAIANHTPGGGLQLWLAGEIDLAAEATLQRVATVTELSMPASVEIDVGEVTFASAAFANFLARIRRCLTGPAQLIVSRPQPHVRRILDITNIDAMIRDETTPARDGPAPPPTLEATPPTELEPSPLTAHPGSSELAPVPRHNSRPSEITPGASR